MGVDRATVLKRCRSLDLDPAYVGKTVKKNRKQQEMTEIMQKMTGRSRLYQRDAPERGSPDNIV